MRTYVERKILAIQGVGVPAGFALDSVIRVEAKSDGKS
jgi:hypothetical protein